MSLADWSGDCAQRYPHRVAVIDAASGRRHTFRGFDKRANQIAHFCERWVGLSPGDCVGLLSTPSDDVLQIAVAAGKLGLTALLLDPDASPDALVAAINRVEPRTVFHGLAQADLGQEIWFEVDSVEHFIPLRGAVDTASFEDIVAHYPPILPAVEVEAAVPWVTFAPKGITWPDLDSVTAASEERGTVAGPLHRADGLATAVVALRSGRCVIIEVDAVKIVESPVEMNSTQGDAAASRRNVPTGRSWLPHEFL